MLRTGESVVNGGATTEMVVEGECSEREGVSKVGNGGHDGKKRSKRPGTRPRTCPRAAPNLVVFQYDVDHVAIFRVLMSVGPAEHFDSHIT